MSMNHLTIHTRHNDCLHPSQEPNMSMNHLTIHTRRLSKLKKKRFGTIKETVHYVMHHRSCRL
jgi:hypothetical protein